MNIDSRIERSTDGQTLFCNARLILDQGCIGDAEAWSVAGLLRGEIERLCQRLAQLARRWGPEAEPQWSPDEAVFLTWLAAWKSSGAAAGAVAAPVCPASGGALFWALPRGCELFDGERAYLLPAQPGQFVLVWQDYASAQVCAQPVALEAYCQLWQDLQAALLE